MLNITDKTRQWLKTLKVATQIEAHILSTSEPPSKEVLDEAKEVMSNMTKFMAEQQIVFMRDNDLLGEEPNFKEATESYFKNFKTGAVEHTTTPLRDVAHTDVGNA